MKKILVALLVLLALGGMALAHNDPPYTPPPTPTPTPLDTPGCPDCWANEIVQTDYQRIATSDIDCTVDNVYNEGASAAVIITPASALIVEGIKVDSRARIEQTMTQTLDDIELGNGVNTVYNTAVQAAWVQNQGRKELFPPTGSPQAWYVEGARVAQTTTQAVYDMDINVGSDGVVSVYNADNKLAVITDQLSNLGALTGTVVVNTNDVETSSANVA